MELHLRQLAEIALAQCPPRFDQVRLEAELDTGYSEIALHCMVDGRDHHITGFPAEASFGMHLSLDDIREEMAKQSGQRWMRCVFRIFPDQSFKLDVTY